MPPEFGSVFRSYARKDPANALGVELITIARNASKFLTPDLLVRISSTLFLYLIALLASGLDNPGKVKI